MEDNLRLLSNKMRNQKFSKPPSLQKQSKDIINEVSSRFEQHSNSTPVKQPQFENEFSNSIIPGNQDKAKFESPPNSDTKDNLRLR